MARIRPNDLCPCGSEIKFKKCCQPFLIGQKLDHPERVVRARHVASVIGQIDFLWKTLHPQAPRRLHDTWSQFQSENAILKTLDFRELVLVDADESKRDRTLIVTYTKVFDGEQDLSYLEEVELKSLEGSWYYFDGFRRSALKVRINPMGIKIGDLRNLFPWDDGLN